MTFAAPRPNAGWLLQKASVGRSGKAKMTVLETLRPTARNRIYDMVRDAGVNVDDWEASRGRAPSAASNPKYCYNWSFVEPGSVVVLNLWHSDMRLQDGEVIYELNVRETASQTNGVIAGRAKAMDEAIQIAGRDGLQVRVVVCAGSKRDRSVPQSVASKVSHRMLDPEPWHVASYDTGSGQCTLVRGNNNNANKFVDQFDLKPPEGRPAERVPVSGTQFVRRADVRRHALRRANGKCEYCGRTGFVTSGGLTYLETHHVVPLHAGGHDTPSNVASLCPDHHREAHFGVEKHAIRSALLRRLQE